MSSFNRQASWRHELTQWSIVVAVAGGVMLTGWAICALAIVVKVGP